MKKITAFNNFASEYDEWFEHHKTEYARELKAVKMALPATGKGLEIGAGTGRFMMPLQISLGIEPSQAMREIATRRGANMIEGTAESLPIDDEQYDYVLFVTTVCFLDSPEKAFKETHRVLKPKGNIIIGMIDKSSNLGRQYEVRKNESRFYKEARFHTVEEVEQYLEKTGFSKIEYFQAILPGDVSEETGVEVKPGYGEGSFVVLKAQKSGA